MNKLHLNIYSSYSFHAAWTSFLSNLISKFQPCYMDSLHFNIYTSHSRNAKCSPHISIFTLQILRTLRATWTAYISTFTLQIPGMLHGEPHFNIFSSDFRHATGTAYFSTFTLQIPAILHGQSTFEHLVCRFLSC